MSKKKNKQQQRDDEINLASYWNHKFKQAMVHKSDYTKRWQTYIDAYNGDYFKNKNLPEYKSDLVSNYIFSIIETIRPIMLDNDPKFQVMPRNPEGMEFSNDLQSALTFEWDREGMTQKLGRELIMSLVTGTSVFFLPWDRREKNVKAIPVNPLNIFPDPLATCVEDAEYIIYASYKNAEELRRLFPRKSEHLVGGSVDYGELVYENNENANIDNQILVLEVWTKNLDSFTSEEKDGRAEKYENGRVITLCPELGVVLSDRANPYKDGQFPFELMKDYDIPGKFWGEGEVAQLLSPQKYMNELNNAILDNAKATANMPWIVDKNSGIGYGTITSRPGLIIRKNPGSDVKREQPPTMPAYVANTVDAYKNDMEQISGVFNSMRGESETGVYTAQGILALQEAGQARVRLKVRLMEDFLGKLATKWYSRMKQFWKEDRFVRTVRNDGQYDFAEITSRAFDEEYDVRIMAGSTMPVNRGAMLDLMIRLAQTQMPDGQALVDREAVVEYLPAEVRASVLSRSKDTALEVERQIAELTEALGQLTEQLEAVAEESNSNDEETFEVIEEITTALEEVNARIIQLQEEHDTMVEEQKEAEAEQQIRDQAYNEGYLDAERHLSDYEDEDHFIDEDPLEAGMFGEDEIPLGMFEEGLPEEEEEEDILAGLGEGDITDLPDDILDGLEELSDEELRLLLQQFPQLADLLR